MNIKRRKILDCHEIPGDSCCTLRISGSEKEVMTAAIRHAIEEHGHKDTPELRKYMRSLLRFDNPKK